MSFFKKIKFLTIYLISCFFINFFSISNLLASDFTLDLSVNEALKNSLELKSQHYKLEATKYSLGEAYSSKDWSSSLSSTFNSSNKQSDRVGAYTNDDTTTSTISLSKNLFDGGESFERYRIAKDNIRLNELRLYKVEQDIILETIEAYLDVYTNQSVVVTLTYDEAVMHCVMNDIYPYKVHKHKSRPNTLYNWYLTTTKGKIVKK